MRKEYELTIRTKAPLAHGAFSDGVSAGNYTKFRREPIVSLPGYPRVPVISGNAIRGVLRRLIMRELFQKTSIEEFKEALGETKGKRAWDRVYAMLCIGGTIEAAEQEINTAELRDMRKEFPALSVLGSAMYSQLMPGMVQIGFAFPLCKETLEAGIFDKTVFYAIPIIPAEDLLTEVGLVRHVDRENSDPENSKVSPMPYTVEALATGTILKTKISFQPMATDLEISCIRHGFEMLTTLGGKSAVGFGDIELEIDPYLNLDISKYLYQDWLAETDIKALLLKYSERVL